MKNRYFILLAFLIVQVSPGFSQQTKPNIIFILADDLGYGELGCYGQEIIRTPHIDQLAAEGLRFTQFYTTTLCASTRCSFITGMDGGHAQVRDNHELGGYTDETEFGQMPLAPNIATLPGILKKQGYHTGIIGKWGLGGPHTTGVPTAQGFDYFLGYLDQKQAHNFYPTHLWENEEKRMLGNDFFIAHQKLSPPANDIAESPERFVRPEAHAYSGDTMIQAALDYIHLHQKEPFFLYLPFTLPHLALQLPPNTPLPVLPPFIQDTPYYGNRGYMPCFRPVATYAGMIELLDGYVGQVMAQLEKEGLADNTLVVFASDNGATVPGTGGARTDIFKSNGELRGWKGALYEGGIRCPVIARWPGKIAAGKTTNEIGAVWDWLPTFCEIGGTETGLYGNFNGVSLRPILFNKPHTPLHDWLYWEVHGYENGIQAVRRGNWKAVRQQAHLHPDSGIELYQLDKDPGEQVNVADLFPEIVEEMDLLMKKRNNAVIKAWNFRE